MTVCLSVNLAHITLLSRQIQSIRASTHRKARMIPVLCFIVDAPLAPPMAMGVVVQSDQQHYNQYEMAQMSNTTGPGPSYTVVTPNYKY